MKRDEGTLLFLFLWTCFFFGIALSAGCASVSKAFLDGEEAAYRAISGEYIAYVSSDTGLSGDQKKDRKRTVRAWRFSLDQAAKVAK